MTNKRGVDSDFIEKVKQANNIVTVASRYLSLRAKGKSHWTCCPFHHEKTPSFKIDELNQFYHCFGCGVSGNVFTLVQQLESLDFYGALELLAKSAGLEMPLFVRDPDYAVKAKKKQRVLSALEEVREFYCKNLGGDNLEYLHNRGISDELIKLFNIGACTSWDGSIKHLLNKGFTEQELVDSGIAVRSDKGRLYDAMGNRITFAIFNIFGDCIGFTGRTTSSDKDIAKYKNTAETIVFNKGSIVYGIDVLKKNKLANFIDRLIVVEGNVDVISLVGAGFSNVVACMGTAMTAFHARVFKRFSDRVYICFDGDAAGQKATLRGLDILATENLDVRVVSIPDLMDPDDFIKNKGAEAFNRLLEEALPLVDYKLEYLKNSNPLKDNLDKAKYLKDAVEVLKPLSESVELELYIPKVAEALGVSYEAVKRAVLDNGTKTIDKPAQIPRKESDSVSSMGEKDSAGMTAYTRAMRFIIASILYNKEFVDFNDLEGIEFENYLYRSLVEKIKLRNDWKMSCVFDEFEKSDTQQLESEGIVDYLFAEGDGQEKWKDCIKVLLQANIQKQLDELKEQYKNTDDIDEKTRIMGDIQNLTKRKKGL